MIKKIIIVLNKELNERNIKRFGFKSLSDSGWNILVINFRKLNKSYHIQKKNLQILSVNNLQQFFKSLFYINKYIDQSTKFFIDHSEFNLLEKLLVKFLSLKKLKKITISISSMPEIKNFFIGYILGKNKKEFFEFLYYFKNRLKSFLLKKFLNVKTYIFFASGTKSKAMNKYEKFFYLHNLDFDNILKKKIVKKSLNYVYLDQDFETNYEFFDQCIKNYDDSIIWKKNQRLFNLINKKNKNKIIIASHPSRKNRIIINNTIFKKNKTFEIISSAKVVFAYDSTAIQIAVLLNKPIVLLTHEYFRNDYRRSEYLKLLQKELDLNIIDLDKIDNLNFLKKIKVNKKKYKSFLMKYVLIKKVKESYWTRFNKILTNEMKLKNSF